MANIRPKTLSFDKEGDTYTLRGITSAEETKIENAITEHQDISGKVDKVEGKGLSSNDYTDAEKTKLSGIAEGATANTGTITGITMNGASKGTSGVVDLGTVITEHQDISGKLDTSLKGAASGLAELDANGKVPTAQLPSYVDDVLEYDSLSEFPATGETGKIYVAKDTNLTYRWSGTAYVEISSSLALGETSSTAYRGDRGADAYAHAVTNKGSAFANGMYKITTNSEGHVTAATAVEKNDITALGIPGSDTDTKVTQNTTTTDNWRKVLLSKNSAETPTGEANEATDLVYYNQDVAVNSSTGTFRTNIYNIKDKVQMQWNTTDACLDFVFI